MKKHSFLHGITFLGLAAVISKLLGTFQKIPMQNIAGDSTFGIYSVVYPFYTLLLFVATAGIPIAVSKFVAERHAEGDVEGNHNILKAALTVVGGLSVVGFFVGFFGAPTIADWIGNSQTVASIRSVSFALLIVPGLSILRGYFQGKQNMLPSAKSSIIEQFVRVAVIIIVLAVMTKTNFFPSEVAAGAMYGSAAGGIVALAYLVWEWFREHRGVPLDLAPHGSMYTYKVALKKILIFALPICLGAIVTPMLNIVDTFTLPRIFNTLGFGEWGAMELYGVYSRGLVMTQFVALLFSSISVAIVPAIVAARAKNDQVEIQKQMIAFVRFTWFFGVAASIGLVALASPINTMLFKNDIGSTAMAILGVSVIFTVMNIITASFLQGLGKEMVPAYHLLVAVIVKIGANLLLVPTFGVNGAAVSMLLAFAVAAGLNAVSLRNVFPKIHLGNGMWLVKTIGALVLMWFVVWLTVQSIEAVAPSTASVRSVATVSALVSILTGAGAYILTLLKLRVVTPTDFAVIPSVERAMENALERLKFPKDHIRTEGE